MLSIQPDFYLNDVDSDPATIYCAHSLMGEKDISSHLHVKGQFLYVEGGAVYVNLLQHRYLLPPRHYMWIPSGLLHDIHPDSPHVTMRNLYFPVEPAEAVFYQKPGIYPVNNLLLEMIFYSNRWNGNIYEENDTAYHFAKALKGILPAISIYKMPLAVPVAKNKRLIGVLNYINSNLAEPISFPQIAQDFGLSERTLSRLFKEDISISFSQYLTLQKIILALQLLPDGKSVKEVATAVGYSSVPTFSNTFFKLLGMRPSEYLRDKDVLT